MGGGGQGTAPNGSGNNTSSRPIRPFRRSPYAVLNLPENSRRQIHVRQDRRANARVGQSTVSEEEIRDAYKRLSRIFHPDKRPPGKEREDAQEMFLELTNACELLDCQAVCTILLLAQ